MDKQLIRSMTKGVYDIQALRIQIGNRITQNFKTKLGVTPSSKEDESPDETQKILKTIRMAYDRVTEGVTEFSKRTKFSYDGVISDYAELSLVDLYVRTMKDEEAHMKRLSHMVEEHPLWDAFLKDVKGVGGTMAAVIISEFDIHKAKYVSSMWKYAGLDTVVLEDGTTEGRSRKKDHLVDVEYVDSQGEVKTKKSITFNPFLKTKLIGVLGSSFLRAGGKYREVYDNYKHRLVNHPKHQNKTKGHIHNMAVRYMVKIFIQDLYVAWKEVEGLEAHPPYHEAKLGLVHSA